MNQTEALGVGYDLITLPAGTCPDLPEHDLYAYSARSGALLLDDEPLALEAITAHRRRFASAFEPEALRRVGQWLGIDPVELIRRAVFDQRFRTEVNARLDRLSPRWTSPHPPLSVP
jgi:hypothetical protein